MSERFRDITALRAIGLLHKTQVNLKTYASRCAVCKTPVPCDTQRLVLGALGGPEPMKADRLSLSAKIAAALPSLAHNTLPSVIAQAILDDCEVFVKREAIDREIDAINKS